MMQLGNIKGVLSDAGGIMFDDSNIGNDLSRFLSFLSKEDPAYIKKIKRFLGSFSLGMSYAHVTQGYDPAQSTMDDLRDMGLGEYCDRFASWKSGMQRSPLQLYPGVKSTIEDIARAGIQFVILTDSSKNSGVLEKMLKNMGLGRHNGITGIVSSKDLRLCKPSPGFFTYALHRYNLSRENAVFLGHDLDELSGADNYSLKTIALNFTKEIESKIPNSIKIQTFADLAEVLGVYGK